MRSRRLMLNVLVSQVEVVQVGQNRWGVILVTMTEGVIVSKLRVVLHNDASNYTI